VITIDKKIKAGSLEEYNKKRDFTVTGEPEGTVGTSNEKPIFVIQKHAARRLHYDFRIEHNGVLLSWSVPKGPSMDPSVKRLAVQTEDHPMDYADFEGVIPEGEYGAGKVIVWDKGIFQNISVKNGQFIDLDAALEKGHLSIVVAGEKLKGGFTLVRTGKDQTQWLLIKMKDDYAIPERDVIITENRPESVVSGKRITEL
jgi:DNA ligase D-like protein (predicted 3'-phosphoesterase)